MRQDVAEYLMLAYKGELAIRDADKGKINRWANDTAKLLVERLKEQIGTPDKPVFTTNLIGQVKEKKRDIKIPDVIKKFITSIGGSFNETSIEYTLSENTTYDQALMGAKVLMGRAFEFHMYPKALWMIGGITTGILTFVCAYIVWLNMSDLINIGIFVCILALFVTCIWKIIKYEKFSDAAAKIRSRVIRSKSMPE